MGQPPLLWALTRPGVFTARTSYLALSTSHQTQSKVSRGMTSFLKQLNVEHSSKDLGAQCMQGAGSPALSDCRIWEDRGRGGSKLIPRVLT